GRIVERERLARRELDRAALELADAQLRALQVDQHADRMLDPLLDGADALHRLEQQFMAGMAHIDAEYVRTRSRQRLDRRFVVRSRSESREDLYTSHAFHWFVAPSPSGSMSSAGKSSPEPSISP